MLLMVVVTLLSCSKNKPKIGDLYKGGYVFKVNFWSGGLCAATKDFKTGVEWGCYSQLIDGANGEDVGDGEENSKDILGGCSDALTAATVCDVLVSEDQDDWYLPSIDELSLLWHSRFNVNKSLSTIMGSTVLPIYASYWSSNEYISYLYAISFNFIDGNIGSPSKNSAYWVRAVRAF